MNDNKQKPEAITIIQPNLKLSLGIGEVLYRNELLSMFVKRQISSRYRQMLLGVLWALIEPLGQLLLITLVFGWLLKVDTEGYPYPVFAFSGMAAWLLFSRTVLATAGSLQENMALISKVYFPRLILPIAATVRELFDSLLMIMLLILLAQFYGFNLSWRLLAIPLVFILAAGIALSLGLWMAAIIVKFRDIRPLLNLALQAGMYMTPIVYSVEMVPERFRSVYELNPMYWIVEFSRWAMIGKDLVMSVALYWSVLFSIIIFFGGLIVFALFERISVDVQ